MLIEAQACMPGVGALIPHETCVISHSFSAQTPSVLFTKAALFMPIEAQAWRPCVNAHTHTQSHTHTR